MRASSSQSDIIKNSNEGASRVLNLSMHAADDETFAVGGLIVENKTGKVIMSIHNKVLQRLSDNTPFTWDPTAHGERQLVYWYYENRDKLGLPDPSELTVITSLDPCAMCTGTLLTAGFNVGVVAIDDYAGINYDSKFEFSALPPNLRKLAKLKFGYYGAGTRGIDPDLYVRDYKGSSTVAFHDTNISSVNLMGCGAIFVDSANHVREVSSENSGKAPKDLMNPAHLPEQSPIKIAYRSFYRNAFTLSSQNSRIPDMEIIEELKRVAEEGTEGNGTSVGFLDSFGNLVLCMPGREKIAPVYTPFMEVVQAYSKTRWHLMNNEKTRKECENHLTVPKYGTFIFFNAPEPTSASGIMTLGAYGSTMEGPIPQVFPTNLQYVSPPKSGSIIELTKVLVNLPPFYTDLVQLAMSRTLNQIEQEKVILESFEFESHKSVAATSPAMARKISRFRAAYM